jgi:dCTP deaminase
MILSRPEIEEFVQNHHINNSRRSIEIDLVSICLHLDNQFCYYTEYPSDPITPPYELQTKTESISSNGFYILPPGGKVLSCSEESLNMPLDKMGFIQTKGSIARGFLMAHPCDGQIDPGYSGKVTFEIINLSDFYYRLLPGMAFASLFLMNLSSPLSENQAYNGRYQNSGAPTPMRNPKNVIP